MSNSSASVISSFDIGTLTTSGSTTSTLFTLGTSNTTLTVGYGNLNSRLVDSSSTGSTFVKVGYVTGSTVLVNVAAIPTVLELSGIYSTTFANVISSNINGKIGLSGVKLLSSGACVNSSGALTLSVVSSSARFAPIGTTIVPLGTLFVDALL